MARWYDYVLIFIIPGWHRKLRSNNSSSGQHEQAQQAGPHTKEEQNTALKWKIRLMVALALPVFLETLDYTGSLSHHFFRLSFDAYDEYMYTVVATAQPHIAVSC